MKHAKVATADDRKLGEAIRVFRLQRGLSQTELGRRIGVSFQQVQKYEKGANRIGGSRLKGIADVLGVSVAQLFGEPPGKKADGNDIDMAAFQNPQAVRVVKHMARITSAETRTAVERLVKSLADLATRKRGT